MSFGPTFNVNANGNDCNDIKRDYQAIYEACQAMQVALGKATANAAHGRNYAPQGSPDALERCYADRDTLIGMRRSVEQIAEFAMNGAIRAIQEREGL